MTPFTGSTQLRVWWRSLRTSVREAAEVQLSEHRRRIVRTSISWLHRPGAEEDRPRARRAHLNLPGEEADCGPARRSDSQTARGADRTREKGSGDQAECRMGCGPRSKQDKSLAVRDAARRSADLQTGPGDKRNPRITGERATRPGSVREVERAAVVRRPSSVPRPERYSQRPRRTRMRRGGSPGRPGNRYSAGRLCCSRLGDLSGWDGTGHSEGGRADNHSRGSDPDHRQGSDHVSLPARRADSSQSEHQTLEPPRWLCPDRAREDPSSNLRAGCRLGGGHFVARARAGRRPAPDDKRE